ncbi:MAG: homocysteine S-methyltransferase family protein [Armatimonadota bacterium]
MAPLLARVRSGEILISDGAMGTFLQARGLQPGECPESWCISHPDVVTSIAEAYIAAGSDLVETNSFGGTRYKLKSFGLEDKVGEINIAAAKLARAAGGETAYVAASIGPTGHIAEDEGGDVQPEDFYSAFKDQAQALEEGGADALCIETMSSIIEAVEAVKACKENTKLPVICTFTFEPGPRGFRTMMGVTPARSASEAIDAGADIVGANCGNGITNMIEIAREIKAASPEALILIHANAGMPVIENGQSVFKDTPEQMAAQIADLLDAGANIIGGCCGTNPDHIRAMANAAKG